MESNIDEMQGKMRRAGHDKTFALPELSYSCLRMTTTLNAAP